MTGGCSSSTAGMPFDWRKRVATIGLNTTIPWGVEVVGGVSRIEADLREVDIRRFDLTGGTERVQLEFGRPIGELPVRIVGGARTIRLERPAGTPLRLRLQGGTNSVVLDGYAHGKKGGDITVDGRGWAEATDKISLEIVGGSKSIERRRAESNRVAVVESGA